MFGEISKTGYISLEQWICWATKHIAGKETKLTKVFKFFFKDKLTFLNVLIFGMAAIKLKKSKVNGFVFVIVLDSPAFSQSLIASNP